jgi:hypothetical protein
MNEIKINRLVVAGLITFFVFIGVEIVIESLIGPLFVGDFLARWHQKLAIPDWNIMNKLLNVSIALFNTTFLIWLYAALRPMFGVGVKTALITSLFVFVFVTSFTVNMVNLGAYDWQIAVLEEIYLLVELPVALIVGAHVYEAG